MVDPLISVVISVYDRKEYIDQAIDSVLNQTLNREKYEILIVTNIDIPSRNGITIIKSVERWLGPKLYEGIAVAKGEIISLLEDDDIFMPNKLAVVAKMFRKYPDVVYYHNGLTKIDKLGGYLGFNTDTPHRMISLNSRQMPKSEKLFWASEFNNSSISIKREVLINSQLSKIKFAVDTYNFSLSLASGKSLLIDPVALTKYRVTSPNSYRHSMEIAKAVKSDYDLIASSLDGANQSPGIKWLQDYLITRGGGFIGKQIMKAFLSHRCRRPTIDNLVLLIVQNMYDGDFFRDIRRVVHQI